MIDSHSTATTPRPEPQTEADSRWSHLPTTSVAVVLSLIADDADRIDKRIPRARKGSSWTYSDKEAKERFEGAWCILDEFLDELKEELEYRRRGGAQ